MVREGKRGAMIPGPISFSIYTPMISASGEAERRTYKLLTGKSGKRWVVSISPEAAEDVYVDGGKGSDGFGGRTLTFQLEDGTSVDFIGPWKTGADGLFADTGYDVRGQYYSRSIVALRRESGKCYAPDIYRDVLHYDPETVLGNPVDADLMAKQYAEEHGVPVFVSWVTKGGGCAKMVKPTDLADDRKRAAARKGRTA